jgi:hypothetical protein
MYFILPRIHVEVKNSSPRSNEIVEPLIPDSSAAAKDARVIETCFRYESAKKSIPAQCTFAIFDAR